MRKLLLIVSILSLIAGAALAKAPLEKPVQAYEPNSRASEVEPNDDYLTANVLTAGDDMNGAIDVSLDADFFAITVTAGASIDFETHAGDVVDTKLYLYDTDGTTQLAYNDDGGAGYYSLISFDFTADGTYFVKVVGYSSSYTGTYILSATEATPPPPPPANDVCTGAIDIATIGYGAFEVDLAAGGYTNQSAMGSTGCTGYSANGPDAFYMIYLETDAVLTLTEAGSCDMSLYVFTDCGDPLGSCVAGSDVLGTESITFDAGQNPGWYYIGIDAYASAGCLVTVTTQEPVPTEGMSFSGLKASFR
ncbi:MAG TPA: PPC domain-containing protein [Candidatus Krumholzibacteria bacterium]|nr:PPC domain-containing protein [Candidatus Krumholzibacteria bacterium]HRX50007.1 PPC domain-containing protein [Candidatus Krumholzibacteria bacterium]